MTTSFAGACGRGRGERSRLNASQTPFPVEGFPYEEITARQYPAVVKFRKLRQDQRLRAAERVLKEVPRP